MTILLLNSFNPSFWDKVKYLNGATFIHICPPREVVGGNETLSQELFRTRQESMLMEYLYKHSVDILLVVDHLNFDFKKWSTKTTAKLVGLNETPSPRKIKRKFKYKTYNYHFPNFHMGDVLAHEKNRTLPLIEREEPNWKLKRDRVAFLYNEEHDPEQWIYTKYIMEQCPKYEYVFLNDYLGDMDKLIEQLQYVKLVVSCTKNQYPPNFQHYIEAFGSGCIVIFVPRETVRRRVSSKWQYSPMYVGLASPNHKKTKKWATKLNQIRLRYKLIQWVVGMVNGYCFRQYDTLIEYNKHKYTTYLRHEEFINKLICL